MRMREEKQCEDEERTKDWRGKRATMERYCSDVEEVSVSE